MIETQYKVSALIPERLAERILSDNAFLTDVYTPKITGVLANYPHLKAYPESAADGETYEVAVVGTMNAARVLERELTRAIGMLVSQLGAV